MMTMNTFNLTLIQKLYCIFVLYEMHDTKYKYQVSIRGLVSKPPRPGTGPRPIVLVALLYRALLPNPILESPLLLNLCLLFDMRRKNFQCIFPENFQCFFVNIILLNITILH